MTPEDPAFLEIRQTLERLNALLARKDPAICAEFTAHADVVLIGSEPGEIVETAQGFQDFFQRLFALPLRIGWEWQTLRISREDDIAWVFANGELVVEDGDGMKRAPYRMTGVLQRHEGRWTWRLFHGSEPATP